MRETTQSVSRTWWRQPTALPTVLIINELTYVSHPLEGARELQKMNADFCIFLYFIQLREERDREQRVEPFFFVSKK